MGIDDFKGNIKYAQPKNKVEKGTPVTEMADPEARRSGVISMSSKSRAAKSKAADFGTTIPKAFDVLESTGKLPAGLQEKLEAWERTPMTNNLFKINFLDPLFKYSQDIQRTSAHFNDLIDRALNQEPATVKFPSQEIPTSAIATPEAIAA